MGQNEQSYGHEKSYEQISSEALQPHSTEMQLLHISQQKAERMDCS